MLDPDALDAVDLCGAKGEVIGELHHEGGVARARRIEGDVPRVPELVGAVIPAMRATIACRCS